MQLMFKPRVTAKEYHERGKDFEFPDLTKILCPHCRKDFLKKHGFYSRFLISIDFTGYLLIRRHICKCCGRTVSSLPFFCHPKRGYSIDFIITVLKHYHSSEGTLRQCLWDISYRYGYLCSRQLFYQYRKQFYQNLNFLALSFTGIYSLEEPFTDGSHKKRARQMLSLIHHTDPPPCDVSMELFLNNRSTYLTHLSL